MLYRASMGIMGKKLETIGVIGIISGLKEEGLTSI